MKSLECLLIQIREVWACIFEPPKISKNIFEPRSVDEALRGWRLHAHKRRDRHDEAARYYDKWHYRFGIQTIALSAIVGTSVFASLEDLGGQDWKIILGLVSIISAATALSGLQTFLNFGARAETFVPRR